MGISPEQDERYLQSIEENIQDTFISEGDEKLFQYVIMKSEVIP